MVKSVDPARASSAPTTWSPCSSVIPFTPKAARPMGRTSFWSNRIAIPCAVPMITSSSPLACITDTSSSSPSMERALSPLGRGRANASSLVRLISPFWVTKMMYGPAATWTALAATRGLLRGRGLFSGLGAVLLALLRGPQLLHRQQRGDLLAFGERHQVDDGLPAGGAPCLRQLVHLEPEDAALAGEDEHVCVRAGDEDLLDRR